MPSMNPRINLTLSPHRYDLLTRLAKLQGSSRAGIISETMELVYPVLERVCVVLEAAQRAQETRSDGLREAVAKVEAELAPMLYEVASQFDLFMDQAGQSVGVPKPDEGAMEQVRRLMAGDDSAVSVESRRRADGAAGNPRPVIRGSGHPTHPKKSAKAPQKSRPSGGQKS